MVLIREIVQQVLTTGHLTQEAENQLRLLLKTNYDLEDFQAFMKLQAALVRGLVQQDSRKGIYQNTASYELESATKKSTC